MYIFREVEGIKAKGNQKFKLGRFELAADLYSQAIDKCPLCAKKKLVLLYRLIKSVLHVYRSITIFIYKKMEEQQESMLCSITYTFMQG